MNEETSLEIGICNHVREAMNQTSGDKAIYHLVEARELLNKLYYQVWHKHHTSGAGPKK